VDLIRDTATNAKQIQTLNTNVEATKKFVEEHKAKVINFMKGLLDRDSIQTLRSLISASVTLTHTDAEKEQAKTSLAAYLTSNELGKKIEAEYDYNTVLRRMTEFTKDVKDWKIAGHHKERGVITYQKKIEGDPLWVMKMVIQSLPVNMKQAYAFLHDYCNYTKTDPSVKFEKIEDNGQFIDWYAYCGFPFPMSPRDYVIRRRDIFGENTSTLVGYAVETEKKPLRKGYVRGIFSINGYLLETNPDHTVKYTFVMQCDPKGNVPLWLVNAAGKALHKAAVNLHKYFNPKKGSRLT